MENRRSEIELQLKQIINESGVEMDMSNQNEDLNLDSLHYISIICEIEDVFDVEIPDEFLGENVLSEVEANKIIMQAREHWFVEE